MRRGLLLAGMLLLMTTLAWVPAHATACDVDSGSGADPHLVDFAGDYEGIVGGNGQATIPYGDVYGDGTDLIAGWINRTGIVYTANIRTVTWTGLETNAIYYFLWTYNAGNPLQERRWVSAQLTRPLPTPLYQFRYGYVDNTGPIGNLIQQGSTTGTMTAGSPGNISIVIPMTRMGSPPSGATLGMILAEARVLLGTSQTGGLVGIADDTDGAPCADLTIP